MEGFIIQNKREFFINLYFKPKDKTKRPINFFDSLKGLFNGREIDKKALVLGMSRAYSGGPDRAISISPKQRSQHIYVIGATRSGKTKAIESWIRQDINKGKGIGVIDPHGDLVNDILEYIAGMPHFDPRRLVYIDPSDPVKCVSFNPLEVQAGLGHYSQIMELVGAFKRIWADSWGARMEEILRNTLLTLAINRLTILEAGRLLTDKKFRAFLLSQNLPNDVKNYWKYRFNPLPEREKAVWIESSLNKINTFCADPYIRVIMGQIKSTFDLRNIMDSGKILLINLSKGKLKENAFLLGALLLAKIQMAALSRVDMPKPQRTPWHLYVDEFQNFATDSFSEILSEAAKFGLSLTLAHQNLDQLKRETPNLKGAILGNAGTHVYFRISREDAEILAKEMFTVTGKIVKDNETDLLEFGGKRVTYYTAQEEFEYYCRELTGQQQRQAYAKIMGDREPYVMNALEVMSPRVKKETVASLVSRSMDHYAMLRSEAEDLINKRRGEIDNILKTQQAENSEQAETSNNREQKHQNTTTSSGTKGGYGKKAKKERKDNAGQPITEDDFFS